MKFAVWGAGQKGKIVFSVLGKEKISCFIDSNKKLQGMTIQNVPIISFEKYQNEYTDSLIIISMLDCEIVTRLLIDKGVPYIMWEKTSGILENDFTRLKGLLELIDRFRNNRDIAIWGVNILSIVLYDYVTKKRGNVSFINCEIDNCLKNKLKNNGYHFKACQVDKIIVTDDAWKKAVIRYPNKEIIDINNLFLEMSSKEYSDLSKFKDIHKNKRCFIIGNGPSLRVADLDKLHRNGEICFATNMIYKVFQKTDWRPQYYVASDMAVLETYGGQIKQLQLPCFFIGTRRTGFWDGFVNQRFYAFNDFRCLAADIPSFSEDITRCIYSYFTVTYTCLQIAMYMGFKEIYLLGIDANYRGYASDKNNHFIENYYNQDDEQRIPVEIEMHFRAYQKAAHTAKRKGVTIYNATRGGELAVFERVELESLF